MKKFVCSRFLPIGIHTRFLPRTIVIQIFLIKKVYKPISLTLKILETSRLSQFFSVWPKKIDDKSCMFTISYYWDSHLFFPWDNSNSNFFCPEKFTNSFLSLLKYYKHWGYPYSVWPKKIDDKSCMFTVSSYWDSHSLFASDDSNSNFCVSKRFQTHISHS